MKKVLLSTLLFLAVCASANAQAKTSDYDLVAQTLNYYLEGGTNRDEEMVKKAFHESARIRYLIDGEYKEANCHEFFSGMKPGPRQERDTRIITMDVMPTTASARVEIEYPTFTFVDYMTLMKIDGEWKIVAKVSYRRAEPEFKS